MNELIKELERDYEKELRERLDYDSDRTEMKVVKYSDGTVSFQYKDEEKAEGGEKDAPRSNKNHLRPSAREAHQSCCLCPSLKRKRRHAALPLSSD